jgi:hypothetical protein
MKKNCFFTAVSPDEKNNFHLSVYVFLLVCRSPRRLRHVCHRTSLNHFVFNFRSAFPSNQRQSSARSIFCFLNLLFIQFFPFSTCYAFLSDQRQSSARSIFCFLFLHFIKFFQFPLVMLSHHIRDRAQQGQSSAS